MVWLICLALLLPTTQEPPMPPIGVIDFYGLRNVSEQQVRAALQIKEGDSLSDKPKEARRRLEALPGVAETHFNLVCCEAGKATLYVGIREKGTHSSLSFRTAPQGKVRLPSALTQVGEDFEKALTTAMLKGNAGEDDSQGHALMSDPSARAIQESFIAFAARELKIIRDVLHHSEDAEQRALAAQVIAYTNDKQAIISDLVEAMRDPAGGVRNNSMRALAVMAGSASQKTKSPLRIPARPFIALLNSIDWTDRNKSSLALLSLTEQRDPAVLAALRQSAVPALIEMARWKVAGHAYAPFFLLGRVANLPEKETQEAWEHNNRTAFIEAAAKKLQTN